MLFLFIIYKYICVCKLYILNVIVCLLFMLLLLNVHYSHVKSDYTLLYFFLSVVTYLLLKKEVWVEQTERLMPLKDLSHPRTMICYSLVCCR